MCSDGATRVAGRVCPSSDSAPNGGKITEDDGKNYDLRALPEALGGPTVIEDTGVP